MTNERGAAFLDLDHTLIDVDAGMRFAHHLVATQRRRIARSSGAHAKALRQHHRRRMTEVYVKAAAFLPLYRARLMRRSTLVRESYRFFRGEPLHEVRAAIEGFFHDQLRGRVYPGARELLEWHKRRGEPTVIVTSAPHSAARLFADELDIDHAAGVHLEHVDGVLTGRVADGPLWGGDKLVLARRMCRVHGWSLDRSFAYSDHGSDAPWLAAMGHPVAVHPNRRLARVAKRQGWPVVDLSQPQVVRDWLAGQSA